jgi:3-deoxy-manno-octulosonate cytidylyltransferase (CMP-KDO synthetase)
MKPCVVAIIPARWGSTRFPGKSLHPILGKPLIQHVWERCGKARSLDEIIIATDDMRIAQTAFDFGAQVALTSTRHRSGTDRIAEVARRMKNVTHVINVQGDEPLVEPALINRLAKALAADTSLPMITAANFFSNSGDVSNPNVVKVVLDADSNALYFSRSAIPFLRDTGRSVRYLRHHGIYGYSAKFLQQFVRWQPGVLEQAEQLEQLRALENGAKIRVLITGKASIGIDTPADVKRAVALISNS